MKYYKDYDLEDFLLDDNFRLWATGQDDSTDDLWEEIGKLYPDKKALMQQAKDLVRTWMEHSALVSDSQLEEQVQRILKTTQADQKPDRPVYRIGKWLSIAASLILAFGFGWLLMKRTVEPTATAEYQHYVSHTNHPMKEVVNSGKGNMRVGLPDGSNVMLTPKGRISYSETFIQNKKREIYLSGEAFFDVTKDAQNPFFVYANGLVTRVLGTSFLVKATDTNVEVQVRSGRVSVLPLKDIAHPGDHNSELLLTPNQQAIFSVKDNMISKSIASMPLELIKSDPEDGFVFENQPVSKVFSALEKVYGIPIIYDAAVMENCSLRVELSHEPFFTKLDIITKTLGASYRVSDGQVVISSEGCK